MSFHEIYDEADDKLILLVLDFQISLMLEMFIALGEKQPGVTPFNCLELPRLQYRFLVMKIEEII